MFYSGDAEALKQVLTNGGSGVPALETMQLRSGQPALTEAVPAD